MIACVKRALVAKHMVLFAFRNSDIGIHMSSHKCTLAPCGTSL